MAPRAAAPTRETPVLIVGAGPFGLSLAAHLSALGTEYILIGNAMSFWREHMPRGMYLRSGLDWHLDVEGEATLSAFIEEAGLAEDDALPLSRDRYLDYVAWFSRRKSIAPVRLLVERLDVHEDGRFVADCGDEVILAGSAVVATGFRDYAYVPEDLAAMLPAGSYGHTCDVVDFDPFRGRSVLIVGGRQSAFESAALLAEAGARSVDVVFRHDTPKFTTSDWSWVDPLMARTESDPGWYRGLAAADRADLDSRFWGVGRLQLEPWLGPRIDRPEVHLWPRDQIDGARTEGELLAVRLQSGARLETDFVLFATGYKVDLGRLPFLADTRLLKGIETRNGFPVLDTALQSNIDGLYFTSIAATQDFGAFFAFTVSARCSASLIRGSLVRKQRDI